MIILGTNSVKDTGYDVANSCRFNDGSSDTLSRTPSASNRRTWTWSCWVKRCNLGAAQVIFTGGGENTWIRFNGDDTLNFSIQNDSEDTLTTNRVFRDISAWYHIVVVLDTTQGTASNRVKIYVNGVQETSFGTATYPSSNYQAGINNTGTHYVGRLNYVAVQYIDMYLSEMVFIDGTALDATSFGEFDEDSGIWKPIDVSGLTFGTNGFYLDFEDSGALGADVSGNTNNFTVNNLTSIDQSTDTCTNNFATLNPLDVSGGQANTLSDGNLKQTTGSRSGQVPSTRGTFGAKQGKWYIECKSVQDADNANRIGVVGLEDSAFITDTNPYSIPSSYTYKVTGQKENNDVLSSYGTSYTSGDIIGIALDLDNGAIWFSKNGTWQNSATQTEVENGTTTNSAFTGLDTTTYSFTAFGVTYQNTGGTKGILEWNFGSPPFAISSGNTDGNDRGNFEYAVPSGYLSLCTANLSEVLG